jgi:hypothetical protein
VGAWSGLDNRPARPASSTATEEPSAPEVLTVGRTTGPIRVRHISRVRRTKEMRRGSPTQRQGRNHLSQLSVDGPGSQPAVRVAQDRVPLGQGGQAALHEDARRSSPLPGVRDPGTGREASRRADRLGRSILGRGRPTRILVGHPTRQVLRTRSRTTGSVIRSDACSTTTSMGASRPFSPNSCGVDLRPPRHAFRLRQAVGTGSREASTRPSFRRSRA